MPLVEAIFDDERDDGSTPKIALESKKINLV